LKQKPIIVFLTGGLGNQLFQLANALTLDPEREIHLEWILGRPRCNSKGFPDIADFRLPERVQFLPPSKRSWLTSKAAGYILRSHVSPKAWERSGIFEAILNLVGNLIFSTYFKKVIKFECGVGIGFSPVSITQFSTFVIGYFQSYKFVNDKTVFQDLKNIEPKVLNQEIDRYKELANIEKPIIAHFRFGDYKNEKTFGIPALSYYQDSLEALVNQNPNSKIWVFSDEKNEAEKVFPSEFKSMARWISDDQFSSAETLEIMRLGISYVIANSTFSWWAATLSMTENPKVICPEPWFKLDPEPLGLIPPNWKRVQAWQ
jgi:hypothetical protein